MKKYISFDVGGTKVKHGLLLEDGTFLSKGSYKTPRKDLDEFLQKKIETIQMYLQDHQVMGVAISLPGFINPNTGYSEQAGAVTALINQNLKSLLESKVPLHVEIENDGNCAAIAEKISGNAKECNDFICVTIGTGIGGGIYVDGKLLHGHRFRAGEFGFMITQAQGKDIGPNLHSAASTSSLISAYRTLKGISENEYVNANTVFLAAEESKSVRRLIDVWARKISYGIFNLASTLNPQKILIGGGITEQKNLLSIITQQLNELPSWDEINIPVELCKHRNNAGMIGAMYHFRQKTGS
ncbi:ROK family protein [Neobacillus vireti]|uniref:ROK family protein n=1 Tax=Neobacillus vireti TaxID=220686 RepID=UPI002FFEAC51